MNFTREPIIETIISPKDGYKLLVRNSKEGSGEEYFVDAVEVVSFGHAFFFRSLERPKAFVVPVSDYEIVEVKETRVALKNVSHDRNIKIGGGKEAGTRQKEPAQQREVEQMEPEEVPAASMEEAALENAVGARMEKRRDKRRHRRRRGGGGGEEQEWSSKKGAEGSQQPAVSGEPMEPGAPTGVDSMPLFSALIPPPPQLISQTLGRYKEKEGLEEKPEALPEELKIADEKVELFSDEVRDESVTEEEKKPPQGPEDSSSESSSIHRMATSHSSGETESSSSTLFKSFPGGKDFYFF